MDEVTPLQSFQKLTEMIAGQAFGTWQFWTVWAVGLVIMLIFGKVFAHGIGKSEKPAFLVFFGNVLIVCAILTTAWGMLTYAAPYLKDAFVVNLVTCIVAGLTGIFLVLMFGPVFWAESRGSSLIAAIFTLAIAFGAMFASDKVLDALVQGQENVEKHRTPLNENIEK